MKQRKDRAAKTARANGSPLAPARPRRRKSGLVGLVVLVAIVSAMGLAAFSALSLKANVARAEIEARLAELTGLSVSIDGTTTFTLLPRAQLQMTRLRIGSGTGDQNAVMRVEAMVADLDLWQAMLGRTRIQRLSMIRPELVSTERFMEASAAGGAAMVPAVLDKGPRPSGTEAENRPGYVEMARYFGAFLARFDDLEAIDIRDGVFRSVGWSTFGVSNANMVISWPSLNAPARLSGSYVWNGQPTEIDLRLASPLAFLGGEASGIAFDMASPPLTLAFDGKGALGGVGAFSGAVTLATPSLSRSLRWLGDPRDELPEIGPMAISAALDGVGRNLNLRDATVTLDGYVGNGAVEMRTSAAGRIAIGGTLAFEKLDLTGFAEAVAPLPQNPFDLQRPIPIAFIDALDLDLRLSAAQGTIGTLPIGELAATVMFKDGVATLDIGDATVLGGRGQARIAIDSRVARPIAKGFASFDKVDSAGLFQALGLSSVGMSGTADLSAEIESPIANWADLIRRSRSTITVAARKGSLSGFDPKVFLSEGTRPFALAARETTVPFETLRAKLKTSGPLISIDSAVLKTLSGTFNATGAVSTTSGGIDIAGIFSAAQDSTAASATPTAPIRFRMQGEWPDPLITSGPTARPI